MSEQFSLNIIGIVAHNKLTFYCALTIIHLLVSLSFLLTWHRSVKAISILKISAKPVAYVTHSYIHFTNEEMERLVHEHRRNSMARP